MRDLDRQDVPGLGEKVVKPTMPQPHTHVGRGVWKRPDGKMETHRPTPPHPNPWHNLPVINIETD